MSDVAIQVDHLGKQYRIGQRERYKALRDSLTDALYAPFRLARSIARREVNPAASEQNAFIWALRDVSFDIEQGEAVGVIGRNGAGKSTLLKILSRITEPTEGIARIHGRVGSLLEVGTGFHPELTGRENIYLNGAVLGMHKREIVRKFDEIVAFAEVEKFLDTPVKHYSSGMHVRLAFAVAAHLEPEILLVDEVLAVGDAAFQKKSLGKMGDVAKQGRTVLFVSHNMGAVAQLCDRAIWLESGKLAEMGQVEPVVRNYLTSHTTMQGEWTNPAYSEASNDGNEVVMKSVRVITENRATAAVPVSAPFQVEIEYTVRTPIKDCIVWLILVNDLGVTVLTTLDTDSTEWATRVRAKGDYISICEIPAFFLKPQSYVVSVGAGVVGFKVSEQKQDILQFEVTETASYPHLPSSKRHGVVMPRLPWRVQIIS